MRPKDELTEREYNDFYKTIAKSSEDPLAYTHFSAEGEIDFRSSLLLITRVLEDMLKRSFTVAALMALNIFSANAITEDESVVGLRDANTPRERPRIDAYDIDETV